MHHEPTIKGSAKDFVTHEKKIFFCEPLFDPKKASVQSHDASCYVNNAMYSDTDLY